MKESDLGGVETELSRERSREMKAESHKTYIKRFSKSQKIEVSRGVEKNNVDRCSCQEGVEVQSKNT